MAARERWIAATWPFVRNWLPAPPARVIDLGCGPAGGFVPILRRNGYDAVGIDPQAPAEPQYQLVEFERAELPEPLDAVVASTSLHHVSDPARVIDRIAGALTNGGRLVVVEWAWEKFDLRTADWCFRRLESHDEDSFLHRHRRDWLASGREWSNHLRDWAEGEGLHRGDHLVRLLGERLEPLLLDNGPYFFPHLVDTTAADEQAAIDAGDIRATRIDWVGEPR